MMIQTSKVSCEIEKIIINRLIHTFFRPDSSCHFMTKKEDKKVRPRTAKEGTATGCVRCTCTLNIVLCSFNLVNAFDQQPSTFSEKRIVMKLNYAKK